MLQSSVMLRRVLLSHSIHTLAVTGQSQHHTESHRAADPRPTNYGSPYPLRSYSCTESLMLRETRNTHLDFVCGLKAVQLVKQFQHGALHLAVATATAAVCARAAYAVHLIHEDDAGCMLPAQGKGTI